MIDWKPASNIAGCTRRGFRQSLLLAGFLMRPGKCSKGPSIPKPDVVESVVEPIRLDMQHQVFVIGLDLWRREEISDAVTIRDKNVAACVGCHVHRRIVG